MTIQYVFSESPPPTAVPPTCSVWVDGVRMADGQPGEPDSTPVVLTDLAVVWGRSSSVDQPSPSTATFRVLDREGGQKFLSAARIGSRVDVRTDAVVYGSPTVPILPALPLVNAYVPDGTINPSTGLVSSNNGSLPIVVFIPPAPFSSDPSAWNSVPRSKPSQTWRASVAVTLQSDLGTTLQRAILSPVTFIHPNGNGWKSLPRVDLKGPGVTGKVTLAGDFQPPDDVWVGLAVTIYPSGPAWLDVAPSVLWNSLGATPTWSQLSTVTIAPAEVSLLAPPAGAQYSALVFSGRTTDLKAQYDLGLGGTVINVTAEDHTAELANRYVGNAPWAAESLGPRFSRIIAESGQPINNTVDSAAAALPVTYRDVDAQPATRLLQELAVSAGGVLWSATNLVTGPYLRLEDVSARPALFILVKDGDGVIRIHLSPTSPALTLSACSVLLDPVEWIRASDDDSTEVAIGWNEQTYTDEYLPAPTGRTVTATDPAAETATGRRRISFSTQLSTLDSASQLATVILARVRAPGWRISGLTWRMDANEPLSSTDLQTVLKLLDGTTRIGLPIMLVDLPSWSPLPTAESTVALYLEGGRYTSHDGYWTIELLVSRARAQGAASVPWNSLPSSWLWNQFDPAVSWDSLTGVGI